MPWDYRPDAMDLLFGEGVPTSEPAESTLYLDRIAEVFYFKHSSSVNWILLGGGPIESVPGAPGIGVATATGSTTATVAFTLPNSDGGAPITSYFATSSPGGITGTLSQAGSGTINVSGLSPSTSYTFVVRAINSVGTSNPSAASNSTTTDAEASAQARYWGNTGTVITDESEVVVLTGTDTGLNNDKTASFVMSGDQYVYYAFPSSFGALTSILVTGNPTNQIGAYSSTTVPVDAVNYLVYKSNQLLNVNAERTFS